MTYEILRFSEKPVIESSQPFRESPLYTLNKQYITIYISIGMEYVADIF